MGEGAPGAEFLPEPLAVEGGFEHLQEGAAHQVREQLGAPGDDHDTLQTPEAWRLHAVESMHAMAEVQHSRIGQNDTQDYRTISLEVPGGTGLYVDTLQDDIEVRVQRTVTPDVPEDLPFSEMMEWMKRIEAAQADSPEFVWRSTQAHLVAVQRHGTEVQLHELRPEEAEESARFLRKAAIWQAMRANNTEVLQTLLPPEHQEFAPEQQPAPEPQTDV